MSITKDIAEMFVTSYRETPEMKQALKELREGMTMEDKIRLLDVIDGKNLNIHDASLDNFERGFHLGIRLGREVFSRRSKDYL